MRAESPLSGIMDADGVVMSDFMEADRVVGGDREKSTSKTVIPVQRWPRHLRMVVGCRQSSASESVPNSPEKVAFVRLVVMSWS